MDTYRTSLELIREHLDRYGVRDWPERLNAWVLEWDRIDPAQMQSHLLRTRRAIGGMGSLNDIFICPEAGHRISSDRAIVAAANSRLRELIHALFVEVTARLAAPSD